MYSSSPPQQVTISSAIRQYEFAQSIGEMCRDLFSTRDERLLTVTECMTTPCVTVTPDTSLEECCRVMEEKQIRRVLVVDEGGACCGIVALADIAKTATKRQTAEVVREVSEQSGSASAVG